MEIQSQHRCRHLQAEDHPHQDRDPLQGLSARRPVIGALPCLYLLQIKHVNEISTESFDAVVFPEFVNMLGFFEKSGDSCPEAMSPPFSTSPGKFGILPSAHGRLCTLWLLVARSAAGILPDSTLRFGEKLPEDHVSLSVDTSRECSKALQRAKDLAPGRQNAFYGEYRQVSRVV
jgi:hypothetical protein